MSDALEGPRRYYDFNYLLKPPPAMSEEEHKKILVELVREEQAGRDLIISCMINAFLSVTDKRYQDDTVFEPYVGTEKSIDTARTSFNEIKNTLELINIIKKNLANNPDGALIYQRLYDFELFLLKKKKDKRLTSKDEGL